MKRLFVLDENVVIFAMTGEDNGRNPDEACLRLLLAIDRNCHALAMSGETYGIYASQLNRYSGAGTAMLVPTLLGLVKSVWTNLDKDSRTLAPNELVNVPTLGNTPRVDSNDALFISVAASVGESVFVTTDTPLMDEVTSRGWPALYGFDIAYPYDALALAALDAP